MSEGFYVNFHVSRDSQLERIQWPRECNLDSQRVLARIIQKKIRPDSAMIPGHSGQVDNIWSCQSCAKFCPRAQLRLNINYCAEMFSYSDAKLRSTSVRKDESLSLELQGVAGC